MFSCRYFRTNLHMQPFTCHVSRGNLSNPNSTDPFEHAYRYRNCLREHNILITTVKRVKCMRNSSRTYDKYIIVRPRLKSIQPRVPMIIIIHYRVSIQVEIDVDELIDQVAASHIFNECDVYWNKRVRINIDWYWSGLSFDRGEFDVLH